MKGSIVSKYLKKYSKTSPNWIPRGQNKTFSAESFQGYGSNVL